MVHVAMILLAFALALWTNKVTWRSFLNPGFLGCTQCTSCDYGHSALLAFVPRALVVFSWVVLSIGLNLLVSLLYFL